MNAAAVELAGPRPETDYSGPVACPECGKARPQGQRSRFCRPCGERLMGVPELRWQAEVWRAQGYTNMAALVLEIAETLVMFEVDSHEAR